MTRIKRPAAAVGAAVLLALSLTACGSDASDAPDDASSDDFCSAVDDFFAAGGDGETPTEDEFDEFQKKGEELADVGTPEGIDEDARKGFELLVETIGELNYDDVENADENFLQDEFSDDEEKQFEAFFTFYGTECAEIPE